MVVIQRINNNVLYVQENNKKLVVMGRGIGFQVHPKDKISPDRVEKRFLLQNDMDVHHFLTMTSNIPQEIIDVTYKIIEEASKTLEKELNVNLIVSLSDHIMFALQRYQEGMVIKNPLHWEIKQIYAKEVEAGMHSLEIIKQELGIEFPQEEAVFLAVHYVNAQYGDMQAETLELLPMIVEVTNIIKYHFQVQLNEESDSFARFATHLRYYLIRNLGKDQNTLAINDNRLIDMAIISYPKEYACATKIMEYFQKMYGWEVNEDEKLYLVLHIHRVISSTENEEKK